MAAEKQPDPGGFLKLWKIHIKLDTKSLIQNHKLIFFFFFFFFLTWKSLRLYNLLDKHASGCGLMRDAHDA